MKQCTECGNTWVAKDQKYYGITVEKKNTLEESLRTLYEVGDLEDYNCIYCRVIDYIRNDMCTNEERRALTDIVFENRELNLAKFKEIVKEKLPQSDIQLSN